jgi:hypothetical protein
LIYYPQFGISTLSNNTGIVDKDAHVNVIYSPMSELYIVWRGLLFIICVRAVESLKLNNIQ